MNTVFDKYTLEQEALQFWVNEIANGKGSPEPDGFNASQLLGFLDLTTLEGADTGEKIARLCIKARFSAIEASLPDAAAVCVYPSLVRRARQELKGSGIKVASVAGGFPAGQTSLKIKLEEVRYAIGEGADEIDTVISRGKLLEGSGQEVFDELCAIREHCGDNKLKVILETGELQTPALIRKASELAILSGADFIKTSTGKIATGATPPAFLVMLDTIREYHQKTGKAVGIKAAGGVRTPDQAMIYIRLVKAVLGEQWLHKDFFRIGASSLADEILSLYR
jgi:deoxyribose-phosphate aldolase